MNFDELPRTIPIFPLAGALLLPGGRLPLNIFEPRYLAMVRDAQAASRVIGMVQPIHGAGDDHRPEVYRIGCLGRIAQLSETSDNRFLITLAGVCRFSIVEELKVATPYRQVLASYARFRPDLDPPADAEQGIDRAAFDRALKRYLPAVGLQVDWKAIGQSSLSALVTTLSIVCPFEPAEKQALLEATSLAERARLIASLMDMAARVGAAGGQISGARPLN